jgi:hypothetical protein
MMRFLDGRWTSAASGTNMPYACETDTAGTNGRYRTWNVTTQSGPWVNGAAACTAQFPGSTFAFPRNGKENADLHKVQIQAGAANVWLSYSSQGGNSLIATANPVPVVIGAPLPSLTFDVSTTIAVPSNGLVLSFTIDTGTGSQLIENTINAQSTLRTFPLPDVWSSKPAGVYNSVATVKIRSASTGATLASSNVPFSIQVKAASTTTISSLATPVAEGLLSTFRVRYGSRIASGGHADAF